MSNSLTPKLVAEFIGTLAFVFIGAGAAAVLGGSGLSGIAPIAFAHGLTIMVFAFAYGSISGGHMNPAVTIGVLAAGAIRLGDALGYIVAQLVGGIAGALLLLAILGGSASNGLGMPQLAQGLVLGATTVTITPAAGFVIEAVLAFFLVTAVLSTAIAGRAGNLAPLAIGMTLTLNIIMGGALTGAAFNPARALAPMVATGNFTDAWLYMTAPVVGAVIAAFVHLGLTRLIGGRMIAQLAATPAE
jgi:MIP family channel proteins